MSGGDRIAATRSCQFGRRLFDVGAFSGWARICVGWCRMMGRLLAWPRFSMFSSVQAVDGFPHERPTMTNTSIDLLGQNFETRVAEDNRFVLPRLRKRWHNGQMIARVQRHRLGDHPHVALDVVKSGVHVIELLAQDSFDRWGGIHKLLERGFNEHALADARSIRCNVKPTADAFTQPNRHLATRYGFAPSRRLNVNAIGLPVQFSQLSHASIIPQHSTIEIAASRTD
jgi:hypothetical protein